LGGATAIEIVLAEGTGRGIGFRCVIGCEPHEIAKAIAELDSRGTQ
jgi:hypothetical protein